MKERSMRYITGLILILASAAFAGEFTAPISNPIYGDVAIPHTRITPIFIKHNFPGMVDITGGGQVPLDGDATVYALQFEIALNEHFSIVAIKDGWIEIDADSVLMDEEGFGDLGFGIKWAFFQEGERTVAFRATVELPIGDEEVFQGNGDGNFSPALIYTVVNEKYTANAVFGLSLPFDSDEESTASYLSLMYAHNLGEKCALALELNWFRILSEGDGSADFGTNQTPAHTLIEFDDVGYFNTGAAFADENADLVTAALAFSYNISDKITASIAYEFPLTEKEASLFDDRWYLTVNILF